MDNPVAWQLWDAESIDLARRHNRLIFLSIGYSACHCMSPSGVDDSGRDQSTSVKV